MRGKIVVVNRHVVGDRKEDFYVGRPSRLGNPFKGRDRNANIRMYRVWLKKSYENKREVKEIIDDMVSLVKSGETVTLSCWCSPKPCHADVICEFVMSKVRR
jgi:hypothetical protein